MVKYYFNVTLTGKRMGAIVRNDNKKMLYVSFDGRRNFKKIMGIVRRILPKIKNDRKRIRLIKKY
jgi:hypothetical protein